MPRSLPAPRGFSSVVGLRWAKLLDERPAFIQPHRQRGARGRGLKYEAKTHEHLKGVYAGTDSSLLIGPWIEFIDDNGRGWCQPDAVAVAADGSSGIVYEIKYRHTHEAWFQLWRKYVPVLEYIFRGCSFSCMEICKWFDPAVAWPEPPSLTPNIREIPNARRTAIHLYNPQRL